MTLINRLGSMEKNGLINFLILTLLSSCAFTNKFKPRGKIIQNYQFDGDNDGKLDEYQIIKTDSGYVFYGNESKKWEIKSISPFKEKPSKISFVDLSLIFVDIDKNSSKTPKYVALVSFLDGDIK